MELPRPRPSNITPGLQKGSRAPASSIYPTLSVCLLSSSSLHVVARRGSSLHVVARRGSHSQGGREGGWESPKGVQQGRSIAFRRLRVFLSTSIFFSTCTGVGVGVTSA